MQLLSRIFGRNARKNYFPPPPADGPPVPEGAWTIVVDANGDRVTDRPPAATDFLARPPLPYIDGGTEPKFAKEPRLDERQNMQNLVAYEIRSRKNAALLEKAVFLLSQTDDGARLLRKAKEMQFTLVFDPALCAEEKALGLCDFSNKKVPLAEGRSAAEVALTLKHELQHMEDMAKGLGYGIEDTPRGAQMADRALEGNARVSEAVTAAEALMGSPQGPARQFRTAALFNNLWQKNPEIAAAAHDALADAAQGAWKAFAQKVLPAYFRQEDTLAYYDERYARFLDKYVPDVSASQKALQDGEYRDRDRHARRLEQTRDNAARLFSLDRWTPEKVAALLTVRGLPYMDAPAGKGFSLASDAAVALTPGALPLFEQVKRNIKAVLPGSGKPRQLDLPQRPQAPVRTHPPSPYQVWRTVNEEQDFAPIRLPDRIDGNLLTSGERSHAAVSAQLNDIVKNMKSGATELDRLNYGIGHYLHENVGIANYRGLVGRLVEAGLRAPIGAFPDNYLADLYGRLTQTARAGVTGERSGISPQELQLLDHWQQMQDRGMDPVWIDAAHREKSWVGRDQQIHFYSKYIAAALKTDSPAAPKPQQALGR